MNGGPTEEEKVRRRFARRRAVTLALLSDRFRRFQPLFDVAFVDKLQGEIIRFDQFQIRVHFLVQNFAEGFFLEENRFFSSFVVSSLDVRLTFSSKLTRSPSRKTTVQTNVDVCSLSVVERRSAKNFSFECRKC